MWGKKWGLTCLQGEAGKCIQLGGHMPRCSLVAGKKGLVCVSGQPTVCTGCSLPHSVVLRIKWGHLFKKPNRGLVVLWSTNSELVKSNKQCSYQQPLWFLCIILSWLSQPPCLDFSFLICNTKDFNFTMGYRLTWSQYRSQLSFVWLTQAWKVFWICWDICSNTALHQSHLPIYFLHINTNIDIKFAILISKVTFCLGILNFEICNCAP